MIGYEINATKDEVSVKRTTKETEIEVSVNTDPKKKAAVETSIPFLRHMIETMAWRGNMNIGVRYKSDADLSHPEAEDIGITIGRALLELFKVRMEDGIEGFGSAEGVIDEGRAKAIISIEGRANSFISGPKFEAVDGMSGYDLVAFLEGLSQGMKCTLQLDYSGTDPHHSWEAVFRALGLAIRRAFKPNLWRKGTIAGMKGTLE